jgi:hypothetical protein
MLVRTWIVHGSGGCGSTGPPPRCTAPQTRAPSLRPPPRRTCPSWPLHQPLIQQLIFAQLRARAESVRQLTAGGGAGGAVAAASNGGSRTGAQKLPASASSVFPFSAVLTSAAASLPGLASAGGSTSAAAASASLAASLAAIPAFVPRVLSPLVNLSSTEAETEALRAAAGRGGY